MINKKKLLLTSIILILTKPSFACDKLEDSKLLYESIPVICNDTKNFESCEKNLEKEKLKKYPFVSRIKNKLNIQLDTKKKLTYLDKNSKKDQDNGSTEKYLFLDFFPEMKTILVFKAMFEEGDYIFINKSTGKQLKISSSGYLLFSPNKKRFLYCNNDFGANSYSVYKVEKDSIILEKELVKFEENFGFSKKAQWLDDKTLCYAKENEKPKVVIFK